MVRYAFTMIELIFALVVMSIVFISLPMILINNSSSLEDNLIQESIFLTSTKMSQVLTFQWDNTSSETNTSLISTSDVVDVTNGHALLDRNNSDYRIGHFAEDKHRRMTPIGTPRVATAVLGTEIANVYDDVDDFDGLVDTNIMDTTSGTGYKKRYRADVNVTYISDNNFLNGTNYDDNNITFVLSPNPVGASTNLKVIEVSIDQNNSDGWARTLLLRSFVANIGETDYFKRRY